MTLRNQDEIESLSTGISDCAKQNRAYNSLIELDSISKYNNEEILEERIRKNLQAFVWINLNLLSTAGRLSKERENGLDDKQILDYKFIKNSA